MNREIKEQFEHYLFIKYPDLLVQLELGHNEVVTDELVDEFCDWLDEVAPETEE